MTLLGVGNHVLGGVHGCCAGWCYASEFLCSPFDSALCVVCEVCRWTVV